MSNIAWSGANSTNIELHDVNEQFVRCALRNAEFCSGWFMKCQGCTQSMAVDADRAGREQAVLKLQREGFLETDAMSHAHLEWTVFVTGGFQCLGVVWEEEGGG